MPAMPWHLARDCTHSRASLPTTRGDLKTGESEPAPPHACSGLSGRPCEQFQPGRLLERATDQRQTFRAKLFES